MARDFKVVPMTEPKTIDCVFCEGVSLEVRDDVIRMVGWIDLEIVGRNIPERRIVARAVMPTVVARTLIRDLRRAVARGGH